MDLEKSCFLLHWTKVSSLSIGRVKEWAGSRVDLSDHAGVVSGQREAGEVMDSTTDH